MLTHFVMIYIDCLPLILNPIHVLLLLLYLNINDNFLNYVLHF